MTLIVVDQFRTTADAYAEVTDEHGEVTVQDYQKIQVLPRPIEFKDDFSFNTITFTGDAQAFWAFYEKLLEVMTTASFDERLLTVDDCMAVARKIEAKSRTRVIVPCPSSVVVIEIHPRSPTAQHTPVKVHRQEGAVHAFGSDYDQPTDGEECRAWFSIFIDAKRAGKLKGDKVHFMAHQSTMVKEDTVLPPSKAKKMKSRFPFRRRYA